MQRQGAPFSGAGRPRFDSGADRQPFGQGESPAGLGRGWLTLDGGIPGPRHGQDVLESLAALMSNRLEAEEDPAMVVAVRLGDLTAERSAPPWFGLGPRLITRAGPSLRLLGLTAGLGRPSMTGP